MGKNKERNYRANEVIIQIIKTVAVFFITFLLLTTQVFYDWDKLLSDSLCQSGRVPNTDIYIIAIDDKTLGEYGPMSSWSRDISRELVEILNASETKRPAVIGFDIMYLEDTNPEVDAAFANTCKEADNIVMAMNLQFKGRPEVDEQGNEFFNDFHVEEADYPYEKMKESVRYGFANTIVDDDGYVRRSIAKVECNDEVINSLASEVYYTYLENVGEEPIKWDVDENNIFGFKYACKSGDYSVISLCDVLDGTVKPEIFTNAIVFVGAYAVGMQDSYTPAISHGEQMYGVEIHANIVDSLLFGATVKDVSGFLYALVASLIVALYSVFAKVLKTILSAVVMVVLVIGSIVGVILFYNNGLMLPVLVLPAMLLLTYIVTMVEGYVKEVQRRKQIVGVFKQYVAPQIVEEISRKKDFKISLGGEKRHIAVLFVDIRGFTTMSESLHPEQVVEILNEYLALTTASIFNNAGTLDKFVGDATMAVFNAPFDLDDYIYRAVKTAWDMKAGSEKLAVKFEERFGKSVAFGVGVNAGEAVVGNIGCDFRMDYTAIGDTVNTAARLESNAKRGQILISKEVYEAVADRVSVTPIGEIPLKGKEQGVFVYQVDDVR